MSPSLPVLRAPPFPGIRPHVAMVSMARTDRRPSAVTGRREDTDALIAAIRTARVGGTFWAPTPPVPAGPIIILRPCSTADAQLMAAEARHESDTAQIVALLPEARWAKRARRILQNEGITVTIGDVDPWPLLAPDNWLLAHGDDELVLLAQIAGARASVRSPGRFAPAAPRVAPTIADRVFADLVAATAYRDPMAGAPAEADATVALLADWRRMIDANRAIAVATGMARWKRREIERFLWAGRERPLRFVRSTAAAIREAQRSGGAIATWPSRSPPGLLDSAAAHGIPVHMVEDGFIRSVGLGAACIPPLSIAVDSTGIHYDPSRPSDLETLLAETDFTPAMLTRAEALIAYIVDHGISKYDRGIVPDADEPDIRDRRRVLVTGQVEDDLSVRMGGAGVAGNLDLLARVRAAEPDAEIWYRPHPDVQAGLRAGAVDPAAALVHADRIMTSGSMTALFDRIDAIHVLTSLAGFEALLRGVEVVVHGQPFYAGWGLTRDLGVPIVRRSRRLTLGELVSGVLILYPRYLDPATGLPCGPEKMTEQFATNMIAPKSVLTRVRGVQGWIRQRATKGVNA